MITETAVDGWRRMCVCLFLHTKMHMVTAIYRHRGLYCLYIGGMVMRWHHREAGRDRVNCSWATYMNTLEAYRKLTSSKRRVLFQTKRSDSGTWVQQFSSHTHYMSYTHAHCQPALERSNRFLWHAPREIYKKNNNLAFLHKSFRQESYRKFNYLACFHSGERD